MIDLGLIRAKCAATQRKSSRKAWCWAVPVDELLALVAELEETRTNLSANDAYHCARFADETRRATALSDELATLRARLAAAERVVEAARGCHALSCRYFEASPSVYGSACDCGMAPALAAYDAARGGK